MKKPVSDATFYDYSFYDNGMLDLMTQFDYAYKASGSQKFTYIGHSQGTTEMFAMLSDTTYFNDKLSLFIACAPIVYLGNVEDEMMQSIAQDWLSLWIGTKVMGLYEFSETIEQDNPEFCNQYPENCKTLVEQLTMTTEYSDPEAKKL